MSVLTNDRLDDLEVKASFTEDSLERLNEVVIRQQEQLDALMQEVTQLRQLQIAADANISSNTREEPPPHY